MKKKGTGYYIRRWLGWVLVIILTSSNALSAPQSTFCDITLPQTGSQFQITGPTGTSSGSTLIGTSITNPSGVTPNTFCLSTTPPDTALPSTTACAGATNPFIIPDNTLFYFHVTDSLNTTRCTYLINIDPLDINDSITLFTSPPNPPTAVPLFTPIGILVTISGLLWFGRRRPIKLKPE